jgi:hypothetical protein
MVVVFIRGVAEGDEMFRLSYLGVPFMLAGCSNKAVYDNIQLNGASDAIELQ